ncbi:MAG TPA: GNAT family N-acetyltransferase [Chitinophagaceae bacterium]|nr:GNAT family N-acetyltransferase [Chitinophagaceae bacterium]
MNIVIRRAVKDDCPRIMELVRELAVYEKAPEAVTVSPEDFTDGGFGNTPVWWAFVAECNGAVQGFALFYIRFSTWKGKRLYLEDFYVTEEVRGKGMGKLLFEEVLSEAKRRKVSGVQWQVLEWNEQAINFYKNYGASLDPEWINCAIDL